MKPNEKDSNLMQAQRQSSKQNLEIPSWQATFSKRLPHRIGQPLSSGGGGDGAITPTHYNPEENTPRS